MAFEWSGWFVVGGASYVATADDDVGVTCSAESYKYRSGDLGNTFRKCSCTGSRFLVDACLTKQEGYYNTVGLGGADLDFMSDEAT